MSDHTPPGKPGATVVELAAVTKKFPGVLAVDRVDLALRPGEVHALLGENGAGKSTIVAMLSGLQEPDAGRLRVQGRDARITSPRQALAHGIVFGPRINLLVIVRELGIDKVEL